ncbi:PepSY domain-containing protein [Streptomyces sp. NPDC102406]|uniref:PepSY domain-containing protein n=1 Tax=Streptomyces sp. NPDC102406 TaxID=3366171 RepID=UPI00380D46EA
MKRRTTTIAAIAAVALLGAGTATTVAVAESDPSGPAASQSSVRVKDDGDSDARENAAEAKGAKIRAEDAIAAALKHTPGTATGADLDSDDGALVWEVDVVSGGDTWHDVDVDPGTGKVLGSHTEKADGDDADAAARVSAALKNAPTSAGAAARAAADKGTVTSVDADDDGAVGAWEVETTSADGKQRDWHVDLRSGAVTVDRSADDEGDDGDDD